jgi:transcriptional regulator with XRE-family HTH domain
MDRAIGAVGAVGADGAAGLTAGGRIKLLRKELNLTQAEFAKIISVSTSLITYMEQDKRSLNDRYIKLIHDSFGVNVQWLKTGEGRIYEEEKEAVISKLLALFNGLKPRYQKFVLNQLAEFLKMQDEER